MKDKLSSHLARKNGGKLQKDIIQKGTFIKVVVAQKSSRGVLKQYLCLEMKINILFTD